MNFLEQLAAEWYSYKGCFVRTNIKIDKRDKGGYGGEFDVVVYDPSKGALIHIESSMDAASWEKRTARFEKKFCKDLAYYNELLGVDATSIKKIAVVGFAQTTKEWALDVELCPVPQFIKIITSDLSSKDPMKEAVSEGFPLLRAIQFSSYYGTKA